MAATRSESLQLPQLLELYSSIAWYSILELDRVHESLVRMHAHGETLGIKLKK